VSHVVKLQVNGADFEGFKGGEVRLGIDQICGSFSLDYYDGRGTANRLPIDSGNRCTLLIDDKVIMDGWVDDSASEYDAKMYRANVSGRSLACDLVDCSAGVRTGNRRPKTSWSNASLGVIVTELCQDFLISPTILGEEGPKFSKFRLQKGERIADAITRLVRPRGLVAYSVGSDLILTRAGSQSTQTVIRSGDQVIRAKRESSFASRYSDYVFKGQTRANDTVNGVNAAQLDGVVQDQSVQRYRPLFVVKNGTDSKADLGQIAVLERNQRAGRSERLSYTVHGWERQEGLWEPNLRVRVIDQELEVDCEMLVVNVAFRFGPDQSYVTELELSRPEAYDVVDYPVRRRRAIRDAGATSRNLIGYGTPQFNEAGTANYYVNYTPFADPTPSPIPARYQR
jgi:prophage tail gpP-like protein